MDWTWGMRKEVDSRMTTRFGPKHLKKKMELPVCKSNMFEALTFEMPIRNIK